jgi:hypothetical protein
MLSPCLPSDVETLLIPTVQWFLPITGINKVSTSDGKHGESICTGSHSCVAVVDSGTSLIAVPPSGVPLISKLIRSVKEDCSNLDQLQDLVFDLAGEQFVMPPSAWVIK